uniref:Uncharacterized protein n=1 Tax=Anopheles farauti TaxID=69004 RepID=A0A182R059_9DIPT
MGTQRGWRAVAVTVSLLAFLGLTFAQDDSPPRVIGVFYELAQNLGGLLGLVISLSGDTISPPIRMQSQSPVEFVDSYSARFGSLPSGSEACSEGSIDSGRAIKIEPLALFLCNRGFAGHSKKEAIGFGEKKGAGWSGLVNYDLTIARSLG